MGAVALKSPDFAIGETEAKRLAKAIQEVQAQYPFVIDAKTQAWLNLAAIGGIIYVPRVVKLAGRKKAAKSAPVTQSPQAPASSQPESPQPVQSAATVPPQGPDYKGPLTPAQLFGIGNAGG